MDAGTPRLADLLWVRAEKESIKKVREEPAGEAKGTVHSADKHDYSSLPDDLSLSDDFRERLALLIPSNASIQEFADRYEITADPWRTTTMLVDGKIPSRAHEHDPPHDDTQDHSQDAQHTHKYTQVEYFADEGKVTLRKGEEGSVTVELVGNAGFESDDVHFSAQRVAFHDEGGKNRQMILSGDARLVDDNKGVHLSADEITDNYKGLVLLEGNARLRRKTPTKTEMISADRIELDNAADTIKAD